MRHLDDIIKEHVSPDSIVTIGDSFSIDASATITVEDAERVATEYAKQCVSEQIKKDASFAAGLYYSRHNCGENFLKEFEDAVLMCPPVIKL